MWYNMVYYDMMNGIKQCGVVWYGIVCYSKVWYGMACIVHYTGRLVLYHVLCYGME